MPGSGRCNNDQRHDTHPPDDRSADAHRQGLMSPHTSEKTRTMCRGDDRGEIQARVQTLIGVVGLLRKADQTGHSSHQAVPASAVGDIVTLSRRPAAAAYAAYVSGDGFFQGRVYIFCLPPRGVA